MDNPSVAITSPASISSGCKAVVERLADDRLIIRWSDGPVDLLLTEFPHSSPDAGVLLKASCVSCSAEVIVAAGVRPYFLVRSCRNGAIVHVAERVLALEQGSNFRDIRGYPAADGRQVRWGLIYRSGGQPSLTDGDVKGVSSLGIVHLVDLRSQEERRLWPTRLKDIPSSAAEYSMDAIAAPMTIPAVAEADTYENGNRKFPTQLAPLLQIIFARLLEKGQPILYNYSGGQDRTGFVSAMILSALGVPRDIIYTDYLLSTPSRRPRWEFLPISDALAQSDPVAAYFACFQRRPDFSTPNKLTTAAGLPFLGFAFQEIERHWGSVDNYLLAEIGIADADITTLRQLYLM